MSFTEIELRPGENLLMADVANKMQTFGSKGGKLFLTDQRLVFKAHGFNIGSKVDTYELSEIQTQGNTMNIKTASNLISFTISFYTRNGETLSFVVKRSSKNEWIEKITNAVTSYVRSNISMPAGIPQAEAQRMASMVKVVQCEGCGAFVIVTAGNVAKCDYCGRPTV